jgi:hypothetical protein
MKLSEIIKAVPAIFAAAFLQPVVTHGMHPNFVCNFWRTGRTSSNVSTSFDLARKLFVSLDSGEILDAATTYRYSLSFPC